MDDTRQSWRVQDEQICGELIKFVNLTEAESALLPPLQPAAEQAVRPMWDEFLGRLVAHPNTKEYIDRIKDIPHVEKMFFAWFLELFCGKYDAQYAARRIGIGRTHVRVGLPVRYPLAMFDVVLKHGEAVCGGASDPAAAAAVFRKVLSIDVAIFNQAYENNQLAHLGELVGGERLARRLLMGLK